MAFRFQSSVELCQAMVDRWHQRFETRVNGHVPPLLGVGDQWPAETYPGLSSLRIPSGHSVWYVFREHGDEQPTVIFCPAPWHNCYVEEEPRIIKFFVNLFNEGNGDHLMIREIEAGQAEWERRQLEEAKPVV